MERTQGCWPLASAGQASSDAEGVEPGDGAAEIGATVPDDRGLRPADAGPGDVGASTGARMSASDTQ